ncbi:hypothetical protein EF847_15160 [Actinobacteria bacterium YIM 96077]|uniref:Ribbon-helix-helix protein CopG domain-containing protein n=1 Tax=Phytoactinopolyspora halophila TaxID=1981511 RepID=A0A329QTH5_9ACTN|nr:hypothetical protein EF847_15160 [Actinobacteria bacterium YIM 96077]RAW15617.1 hypothetical protein DPM12_08180 [Phytoactinopolyspora halophila]
MEGLMARVRVYKRTSDDAPTELDGWFDSGRAEKYESRVDTDRTLRRGKQRAPQVLYHTEDGAWVREMQLGLSMEPHREFISEAAAHDWLTRNGHEGVADDLIDLPREQGPGRPEIGGTVQVRLGRPLLPQVDDFARRQDCSRAEAIRRLITAGLEATG